MAKKPLVPQLPIFTKALTLDTWYSGKDLSVLWDLNAERRSQVIQHLIKRDIIERTGVTVNTRYRIIPEGERVVKPKIKKTGLKAVKPEQIIPSPLDALIKAASIVGTQNELLQSKLNRIKAILEE